ncbi:MAG: aldo/keto reductase [Acidobacteriaceae bacterium]
MQMRKLGTSTLQVPVLCLGGNVYGWTLSEADSFRQLDRAVESGLNFVDTADVYSRWAPGHKGGESESILGKWFTQSGKRSQVILATKVGMDMGDGKQGLKAAYIQQAVEDSLRRLQTDYIDLYQSHKDDEATPLEETLTAYSKLIQAGKVRHIGASNYSGKRLAEAIEISRKHNLPEYVSLQPHYNLVHREEFEADLLPVVQKYNLGVIPYFALAAGFLTGKYRTSADAEGKARGGMVGKYINEHGLAVLDALDAIARRHNSTPAAVALAWLIALPGITSPIASATSESQFQTLVAATQLKLDAASIELLNRASAPQPARA